MIVSALIDLQYSNKWKMTENALYKLRIGAALFILESCNEKPSLVLTHQNKVLFPI